MSEDNLNDASLGKMLAGWRSDARIERDITSLAGNVLPADLGFGPDYCIVDNDRYILVHELGADEVPPWVADAAHKVGRNTAFDVLIIVRSANENPLDNASAVIDQCIALGFGLACEAAYGTSLIIPPRFTPASSTIRGTEHGHIPSWIIQRLSECSGFSDHMKECLRSFSIAYREAIAIGPPAYIDESKILIDLVHCIFHGDARLFVPIARLQSLQEYELSKASQGKRDHYFHTFNDYFIGLILLAELFNTRTPDERPDKYLGPNPNENGLHPWEALWSLTCLFHDPGYIAENPFAMTAFALGLQHDTAGDGEMPDELAVQILDAWQTLLRDSRTDLLAL